MKFLFVCILALWVIPSSPSVTLPSYYKEQIKPKLGLVLNLYAQNRDELKDAYKKVAASSGFQTAKVSLGLYLLARALPFNNIIKKTMYTFYTEGPLAGKVATKIQKSTYDRQAWTFIFAGFLLRHQATQMYQAVIKK